MSEKGKLVLVATPIGNLGDLSSRAIQTLTEADFWLVEDTRVSGKLQSHLELKRPMRLLNEQTSDDQVEKYANEIAEGKCAAIVTDGGTPGISDPGAHLADQCHERGVEIDAIPGPSAVTTALMLSGFYAQRFCFLGFLGRKSGAIRDELMPFADSPMTLVLFESPFRVDKTLSIAGEVLGSRRVAICREMTKFYQQIVRGTLTEPLVNTSVPSKGEFTIVIEGKRRNYKTRYN